MTPTPPEFDPMPGLTIDPPGSRDLDDALWLEDGMLTVYIPDVTGAVPPGDPVEQRARERGYTRYFAQGNAPMPPRLLAEDRLSLLPDERRRVFAIRISLDDTLAVTDVQAQRGVLRSRAQLTYADLPAILADPTHPLAAFRPMLTRLRDIADSLLRKQRERGELVYYDLRQALTMDEEGRLRRLQTHEVNIGCIVVQEMMVLANRVVAELLLASAMPALYRNHRAAVAAPPREALLAGLGQTLAHPEAFDLQTLGTRLHLLLGRARYSPVVEGHYGLNLPCYAHTTSPLRRYADFVNNRVLGELIDARQEGRAPTPPYNKDELAQVGEHLHTLLLEQEQRREASYRARAESKARQRIEQSPDVLTALPASDFERVLKMSAREPSSPNVLASLRERMRKKTLRERECFLALFETSKEDAAWNALRREALDYLAAHPPMAVSMLAMGSNLLKWPETRYKQQREGQCYGCQASQTQAAGTISTETLYAVGKKAAQQASSVALCHLLCGIEPPKEIQVSSANSKAQTPVIKAPAVTASVVQPCFDWGCIQPLREAGSNAGALQEACARR